jgi:hypothetical protein
MKRHAVLILLFAGLFETGALAQTPRAFRQARLRGLSGDERARLQSAHQTAMRDPALRESREKFQQARKDFRERLRDGMIKADPSVQPIIEKVRRQRHEEH